MKMYFVQKLERNQGWQDIQSFHDEKIAHAQADKLKKDAVKNMKPLRFRVIARYVS